MTVIERSPRCQTGPNPSILLADALATLAAAKARLDEATAPGPVQFDRIESRTTRRVVREEAPEVVRLRTLYLPPPVIATSLLSIFA